MRNIYLILIILIISAFNLITLSFPKMFVSLSLLWQVKCSKFAITDISFSYDNKFFASVSRDYIIKVWNTKNGKLVGTLGQAQKDISDEEDASIAFFPCGQFLASLYTDYQIKIWQLKNSKLIYTLKCTKGTNHGFTSLVFSPNGKFLISNSGTIIDIWDIQQKHLVCSLRPIKIGGVIQDIAISSDGKLLSIGGEIALGRKKNLIEIYFIHNSKVKLLKLLEGHKGDILSITFSPDNRYLASSSNDGTVNIYSVHNWHLTKILTFNDFIATSISFSSQKLLAIGTDNGKVILYQITNWQKLREIQMKGRWIKAQFSPNGKFLGIGDNNGWIYMYLLK